MRAAAATTERLLGRFYISRQGFFYRSRVKLGLHTARLAAIGTNATNLRGLFGWIATLTGWIFWLLVLLRDFVLRVWYHLYRFLRKQIDRFSHWVHTRYGGLQDAFLTLERVCAQHHHRSRSRPIPLIFMACAVVMIISGCFFGLGFEVRLNGEPIGYVENRSQIESVIKKVENRISVYLGEPYSLPDTFSYSLRYLDHANMVDSGNLENQLFASVNGLSKKYVLSVDDEVIGASGSKTALEMMLRRILMRSSAYATTVNTSFVNKVTISETTSSAYNVKTISQMETELVSNKDEVLTYTVQKGDTVSGIGLKFNMKISEIKALNPSLDISSIHVGDVLMISAATPYLSVKQTLTKAYSQQIPYETTVEYSDALYTNQSKIKVAGVYGKADVVADIIYINGVEQSRTITSYTVVSQPVNAVKIVGTKALPKKTSTGQFVKPCSGVYSSGYGYRKSFGDFHTGVDFAAPKGSSIWAADGGTVTYAGWKGTYGYLVIIDHGNGYVTYYAHCSKLLVTKGQKVAKREAIAKVGSTGNSTGPHCHFEVRYKGKTKNPLNYVNK